MKNIIMNDGKAFSLTDRNIIPAGNPPENAFVYTTFEFGFGAPFSIGWWWKDAIGNKVVRFHEWYGWNGQQGTSAGIRMDIRRIAAGIRNREYELGLSEKGIFRVSGLDSWHKLGDSISVAEDFLTEGVSFYPEPIPPCGIREQSFRSALSDSPPRGPRMVVCENCAQFLRTVPMLTTKQGFVVPGQEDVIFRESCQILGVVD